MDERYPNTSDRTWSSQNRSMTDQARSAVDSAREGLGQAGEYITDTVSKTGEYINDTMTKTQQTVARYRDGGMDQVKQDVVEYTREQPVTALMIATGAGLLLGMLMAVVRK